MWKALATGDLDPAVTGDRLDRRRWNSPLSFDALQLLVAEVTPGSEETCVHVSEWEASQKSGLAVGPSGVFSARAGEEVRGVCQPEASVATLECSGKRGGLVSRGFLKPPCERASTSQSGALWPLTAEVAQGPSRGTVMRRKNSSIWNGGVLE